MAVLLFAIDIYGLNLTSFFADISFFVRIPTCLALIFQGIFAFYLAIVWACAYKPYQKLYTSDMSERSYVLSNISFCVPILLPWFLLSGITDIINVLPYDLPKDFLSTTEGEAIYFFVFLFAVAVTGPVLIQKFWRCRPLNAGYDRRRIENLCRRADLEYADILYWPIFGGRMITAGVMGLVKRFRYILVTDGLLRYLSPEEIDAVIAHEIGHIKKKHLLFYMFFLCGYLLLSYATFNLVIYFIIYSEPLFRFISGAGLNQATITSAIFSLVIILIFVIYFRYVFGYFMRNFERQADAYVYTLFENGKHLISTFEKIVLTSGQPPDKPNWHHFSIAERIGYLKKCEKDKIWITRHDQKIKKSIAAYLAGILLIAGIGYNLNFGETGRKMNARILEKTIQRAIERNADNPALHSMLGDICYDSGKYERTIAAYEKSLKLKPDNPQVLNNLAWLYATCKDERLRDLKKSLTLAQKAAASDGSPHILDTLAESYYLNGQFESAVSVGRRALELSQKNRFYYKKQLEKFMNATLK
ncbi:M48 family metalloprotease [Desulfobacterales bacterium HSG2]|nr:M48 family metalloprotease [Desulfobacterales bacterium HSG2]